MGHWIEHAANAGAELAEAVQNKLDRIKERKRIAEIRERQAQGERIFVDNNELAAWAQEYIPNLEKAYYELEAERNRLLEQIEQLRSTSSDQVSNLSHRLQEVENELAQLRQTLENEKNLHKNTWLRGAAGVNAEMGARFVELGQITMLGAAAPYAGTPTDQPELPRTEVAEAVAREIETARAAGGAVRTAMIDWLKTRMNDEISRVDQALEGGLDDKVALLGEKSVLFARLAHWMNTNGTAANNLADLVSEALSDESFVNDLLQQPVVFDAPVVEQDGLRLILTQTDNGKAQLIVERPADGTTQIRPIRMTLPVDLSRHGISLDENGQIKTSLAGLAGLASSFDELQIRWFAETENINDLIDADAFEAVAPAGKAGAENLATKAAAEMAAASRTLAVDWFERTLTSLVKSALGDEIARGWLKTQPPFKQVNAVASFDEESGQIRIADSDSIESHGINDYRLINTLHALRNAPALQTSGTAEFVKKIMADDGIPQALKLLKAVDEYGTGLMWQVHVAALVRNNQKSDVFLKLKPPREIYEKWGAQIRHERFTDWEWSPDEPYLRAIYGAYVMAGTGGAEHDVLFHGSDAFASKRNHTNGEGVVEFIGERAHNIFRQLGRDGFDVFHQGPRFVINALTAFFTQPPIDPKVADEQAERLIKAARAMLAGSARGIDPYEDGNKASDPFVSAASGENARLVGWFNLTMRAAWLKGYANAMRLTQPTQMRAVSNVAHHQAVLAGFRAVFNAARAVMKSVDEAIEQARTTEAKATHPSFDQVPQALAVIEATRTAGGKLLNTGERAVHRAGLTAAVRQLALSRLGWNLRPGWVNDAAWQRMQVRDADEHDKAALEKMDQHALLPLSFVEPIVIDGMPKMEWLVKKHGKGEVKGAHVNTWRLLTIAQVVGGEDERVSLVPLDDAQRRSLVHDSTRTIARSGLPELNRSLDALASGDTLDRIHWWRPASLMVALRGEDWPVRWLERLAEEAERNADVRRALMQMDLEADGELALPTLTERIHEQIKETLGVSVEVDRLDPAGTLRNLATGVKRKLDGMDTLDDAVLATHLRLAALQINVDNMLASVRSENMVDDLAQAMITDADRTLSESTAQAVEHQLAATDAARVDDEIVPGADDALMRDHLGVLDRDNPTADQIHRVAGLIGLDKAPVVAAGSLLSSANNTGDVSTALFEPQAQAWHLSVRGMFNLIALSDRLDPSAQFWLKADEADVVARLEEHAETLAKLRRDSAPAERIAHTKRQLEKELDAVIRRVAQMMGDYELIERRIAEVRDNDKLDEATKARLVERLNEIRTLGGLEEKSIQAALDRLATLGKAARDILGDDAPVINSPASLSALTLIGGAGVVESSAELDDLLRTTGASVITSPIHRAAFWRDGDPRQLTPPAKGEGPNPWNERINVLPTMEIRTPDLWILHPKEEEIGFSWKEGVSSPWKRIINALTVSIGLNEQIGVAASNLREIQPLWKFPNYSGANIEWQHINSARSTIGTLPSHGRYGLWITGLPAGGALLNKDWPKNKFLTPGFNGVDRAAAWYAFAAETFRTGQRPISLDFKTFMDKVSGPAAQDGPAVWLSVLNWLERQRFSDALRKDAPLIDKAALEKYAKYAAGLDNPLEMMARLYGGAGLGIKEVLAIAPTLVKESDDIGYLVVPEDILEKHPLSDKDAMIQALKKRLQMSGDDRFDIKRVVDDKNAKISEEKSLA